VNEVDGAHNIYPYKLEYLDRTLRHPLLGQLLTLVKGIAMANVNPFTITMPNGFGIEHIVR
jgi:hypothetical protein